jgi:D-3-phosphoglycerate dehydrogenase
MASILVSDALSERGLEILRAAGHTVAYRPGLKGAELVSALSEAEALVVRSGTRVTAELIAGARSLRLVGRAGVGVDNIDVAAAEARGIEVLTAAEGSTVTVAEHTMALILALARRVPWAHASMIAGRWERGVFTGVELAGRTLGIIGLGRIGRAVAKRAAAFDMRVIAFDSTREAARSGETIVEWRSFEEVLERADVLSFHVPLTAATRGLLDAEAIARLRPGVLVVNTSRGGVVDERALLAGLDSGRVAGAALDVFEQEPPSGSPLVGHPKVIVTPHVGAATHEAQEKVSVLIAEKVVAALAARR